MTKHPPWYTFFLALFRLHQRSICVWSRYGPMDHHNSADSEAEHPWHFIYHKCRHCGEAFRI